MPDNHDWLQERSADLGEFGICLDISGNVASSYEAISLSIGPEACGYVA